MALYICHHIAAIELQCSSEWDSGGTFSVNMSWSVRLSCAGVENPVLFTLISLFVDTRSGDTAAVVGYNSSLRVAHVAAAEEVCLVSDLFLLLSTIVSCTIFYLLLQGHSTYSYIFGGLQRQEDPSLRYKFMVIMQWCHRTLHTGIFKCLTLIWLSVVEYLTY